MKSPAPPHHAEPLHADTVRLNYRHAPEGNGTTGQMGVKNIVS
ncbi:hypothetical protein [Afifella sp. IM 167]|nr:hypothetical protein [Afifella sp. IM 167]